MLFPEIPQDFAALSDEDLAQFASESAAAIKAVTSAPSEHVSEELSSTDLLAQVRTQAEALEAARTEIKARETAAVEVPAEIEEPSAEALAEFAELAKVADEPEEEEAEVEEIEEPEVAETAAVEPVEETPAPVVASAAKTRKAPLPKPARERRAPEREEEKVSLVATAGAPGYEPGQEFPSMEAISEAMQARRRQFGIIPSGTSGEKVPIVRANWSHLYPESRKLSGDAIENEAIVASALKPSEMKKELERRREGSLTASGGLCAPVTPYYQLQMISAADRPVRAALPAFNADRGGIRFARPASLASITSAAALMTASDDEAGGTTGTKGCQVVDCPNFDEVDVAIIYHCLQFGNLGARTFPERVTQWNNLVLAAHARLAESALLTGIDTASTQVTAGDLGLGASAALLSQISTAASGMRSRHRMAADAVLRVLLPWWAVHLIVSDVFRGQFQRFDVDQARVVALLRSLDIEPSFYIDGADGRGQVYGAQSDGGLLPFPATVTWYLYPEGSFLYVDGGVLELGLVRDSTLNSTNDFQIFGETFENVAFTGVESLAVESTTCDSGTVSLPDSVTCPIDYTVST